MIGMFRRTTVVLAALLLAATACGGEDESPSSRSEDATARSTSTSIQNSSETEDSLPEFEIQPREFAPAEDAKIRFVNFYTDAGSGQPVDLYWGTSAESGKLIGTLEPGAVGEWMDVQLENDPLLTPSDGSVDLKVTIQRKGEKSFDGLMQQLSQTMKPGVRWTVVMGAEKAFDAAKPNGMTTQLIDESRIGTPADGKALLILNDIGVRIIEDGDFMSLGLAGVCDGSWSIDNSIDSGNGGTSFVVDAGELQVVGYDANTDCSTATQPIPVSLASGDRVIVLAHGTTKADRVIEVLTVGE